MVTVNVPTRPDRAARTDTTAPLGLLVLRAQELRPVCEFYSALGLHFVREQHGNGPVHYAATLGTSVLEIYPLRLGEPIPDGGMRLGFSVPSLEAAVIALCAARGSLQQAPWTTNGERHALLEGPEGHSVEIIERAHPQALSAAGTRATMGRPG
jgi:catechol 2,3-dioxygenase-like lactoylglutathione lyase family enzyme